MLKKYIFLFLAVFLLIFKLYILHDVAILGVPGSLHDDLGMVVKAENLISGKWLGNYDQLTFVKGPTYPFFLALSSIVHVSSVMANSFFYALSVIIFIFAVRVWVKKESYLFFIFVVLFLSPISYAADTFQRLYRDDIYYGMILILVSCYIALIVRRYEDDLRPWICLLTIDFIAVMLCREDSVWVVPLMLIFSVIYIRRGLIVGCPLRILNKRMTAPFVGLLVSYFIFGMINYSVYGKFIINEMQYSSFTEAYGLLCSIKTEKVIPKVKLSKEAMEKAYMVSPTFRRLKPYYEGEVGDMWRYATTVTNGNSIPEDEIGASHSMWALRSAVSAYGKYESPQSVDDFYNKVIQEIKAAMADGRLQKEQRFNVPLFSTLDSGEWLQLGREFLRTAWYVLQEEDLYCKNGVDDPLPTSGDLSAFEKIAHQRAFRKYAMIARGWVVSKRDEIQLVLVNYEDGTRASVKRSPSEDVSNHFAGRGLSYPDASRARFFIEERYTPSARFALEIRKEDGILLKKIDLDQNMKKMGIEESGDVISCLDYLNIPDEALAIHDKHKTIITRSVSMVYATINKILIALSLVLFGVEVVYSCFTGINKGVCVLGVLWAFFLLRIFVIAYNSVTAFNSCIYGYLSPCYPLMAAIVGIQMIRLVDLLWRRWEAQSEE